MQNHEGKAMAGSAEDDVGRRRRPWRIAAWVAAGLLLLVPLIAMRFTDEVNWTTSDFVFAAVLLFGSLGVYELAARTRDGTVYRAAVGVALAAAVLLIWINGAVGIIGSENNDANLMYGGVLAVGIIGAAIARVRPAGMAWAMVATALAQALVAAIALMAGWGTEGQNWPQDIVGVTAIFVAMWVTSAGLFRQAARAGSERAQLGAVPADSGC